MRRRRRPGPSLSAGAVWICNKFLASPHQLLYLPVHRNESSSSLSSLGPLGSQCCRGILLRFGGEERPWILDPFLTSLAQMKHDSRCSSGSVHWYAVTGFLEGMPTFWHSPETSRGLSECSWRFQFSYSLANK